MMKPVLTIHYILLIPILILILGLLFIEKMGNALGSEKKPKNEESPKKSVSSPAAEKVAKDSPAKVEDSSPQKTSDKGDKKAKVCTPPKAEEVIQVPATKEEAVKASPEK